MGLPGRGQLLQECRGRDGFLAADSSVAGRCNRRQRAGLYGGQAAGGRLPERAGTC